MKKLLLKGFEGKVWEMGIRHQTLVLLTSPLIPVEEGPPHAFCVLFHSYLRPMALSSFKTSVIGVSSPLAQADRAMRSPSLQSSYA